VIRWFCVDLAAANQSTKWLTQLPDILDWAPTPDPEAIVSPDVIFVRETSMLREYGPRLLFALERHLQRSGYGWHRGLLLQDHIVLLNTDTVVEQLRAGNDARDPADFVEISVVPGGSVWLRPVHLTDPDAGRQLRDRVPAGQRAMLAGYASRRVVKSFVDDGWVDQIGTVEKVAGDPLVRCCLTTPGLATVAGSAWVDTSEAPYSWRRAFGGVLSIDVTATDRG
jgi:hypothetical protein